MQGLREGAGAEGGCRTSEIPDQVWDDRGLEGETVFSPMARGLF